MMASSGYLTEVAKGLDPVERERLIVENLPLVRWVAHRVHDSMPPSITVEDLVSSGVLGLIAAVDNFDPRFNVKLGTYAVPRIRGAMLDSIRGLDGISSAKRRQIREVENAISRLEQNLGRSTTEEEVAAELGMDVEDYLEMLPGLQGIRLTALENTETGGRDLLNLIAEREELEPSWRLERAELEKLLARGVERLPENERLALTLYFHEELTLKEISTIMGVHLTRVSQLKTQALLRLRALMDHHWPRRGGER